MTRAAAWTVAEVLAWCIGVACLASAAIQYAERVIGSQRAVQAFAARRAAVTTVTTGPDTSLWSPQRVTAWQLASSLEEPAPLAMLRIPRLHVTVPVLEGTDDSTLNRAAGHIEDTAPPGGDGNAGIAAHRDGFFRGLKDTTAGDVIELETATRTERYLVTRIWIVGPDDVSVLEPTGEPSLTLVTCYPFYFVGAAPKRFIVRAVRARE